MDDLIKKFENLNVFVNQSVSSFSAQQSAALSEIRSIASTLKEKTPARTSTQIKVKNPPVPVADKVISSSVNSLAAGINATNIRCWYCGLVGHYKDRCTILVDDILAGAKVMLGRNQRLHWVVPHPETGKKILGGEVSGHRDGARKNVVDIEMDSAYVELLSRVDDSITIESFSFGVAELAAHASETTIKPSSSKQSPTPKDQTPSKPTFKNPPRFAPTKERSGVAGVIAAGVITEVSSSHPLLLPSEISQEEALRVVLTLPFGSVTDRIRVSDICESVAKMRAEEKSSVNVQAVKRGRDILDVGDQATRIVIDWPPKAGTTVIEPRPTGPLAPLRANPSSTLGSSTTTQVVPGTSSGVSSFPESNGHGPKKTTRLTPKQNVGKDPTNINTRPDQGFDSSLPSEKNKDISNSSGKKDPKRDGKGKKKAEQTTDPPNGDKTIPQNTQKLTVEEGKQSYGVKSDVWMSDEQLLRIIQLLFETPIGDKVTWGELLSASPRALRMVLDKLRTKRVPLVKRDPNSGGDVNVGLTLAEALQSKPDRKGLAFDLILSCFLEELDYDHLVGSASKSPENVVNSFAFKIGVDDILDSFSQGIEDPKAVEVEDSVGTYEARCKVVAASPSLAEVTVGKGPGAVTLQKVTLDGGSQVITVKLSVYEQIGAMAGIEEGSSISMRGAHGHTRKLVGLVPRLPINVYGLSYYVQAFIIDDRIEPRPPFSLLLGQPFLDLARADTFWSENGDQWTRFR
ncbi:hypothetical protein HDU67_002603, partial [Dinochytrium kinnereticum]